MSTTDINSFHADKEMNMRCKQNYGKCIGFFEDGNFHPDFIVWLLYNGKQYASFIDPKGIRNLKGLGDPKIKFCHTIKQL